MSAVRAADKGPRRTRAEWYADAKALRDAGCTGLEIARRLGLSSSFVYELLNDPDGSKVRARKDRNRKPCRSCGRPTAPETLATGLCKHCYADENRAPHGTRSRYSSGCRCAPCTEANTVYQRTLVGKPPPRHGLSGYMNYGCRCPICRQAHSDHRWRYAYHARRNAASLESRPREGEAASTAEATGPQSPIGRSW